MTNYANELRRQIVTEDIREELVKLLLIAASYGHGMENRQELEELAEFLSEEIVRRAKWK